MIRSREKYARRREDVEAEFFTDEPAPESPRTEQKPSSGPGEFVS